MYKLRNYSEELVDKLLNQLLPRYTDICKCEKCLIDIKALALNSIKPKYIVTDTGEIYTKSLNEIDKQEIVNITAIIANCIEIVSKNPKHDD